MTNTYESPNGSQMDDSANLFLNKEWAEGLFVDEDGEQGVIAFTDEEDVPDEEDEDDDDDDDDEFDDDDFNDYQSNDPDRQLRNLGFDPDERFEIDDEDQGGGVKDALREASNFKPKKRKGGLALLKRRLTSKGKDRELNPEVKLKLSHANEAFVSNDLQVAFNLYTEVIKDDPKNFSAYKTLGEICKIQGDLDKCCNHWFMAANIHPWDSKFWATVAELSVELKFVSQAIYCYGRAITSSNGQDAKSIFERAALYRETNQHGRALESFQKLHQMLPEDTLVIKELAMVYVYQNRTNDAIDMYRRILDENIRREGEIRTIAKFTWSELNILVELYDKQKTWDLGIQTIKLVSRWLQRRADETWWDDNDDSEFDARRESNTRYQGLSAKEKSRSRTLPIDIRVKLGFFRLYLKQSTEALRHFDFLFKEDINEVADLFLEVGKALEEVAAYDDALRFLEPLSFIEAYNNPDLVLLLADCLQAINDFEQAHRAYLSVLQVDPDNLDVKTSLIHCLYHLGDFEQAKEVMHDVIEATHVKKAMMPSIEKEEEDEAKNTEKDVLNTLESLALISNKKVKNSKKPKLSDSEKEKREQQAKKKVLERYKKLEKYEKAIMSHEPLGIATWSQIASQLVEMFMGVKSFFPRDKSKIFKGVLLVQRRKNMGLDEKLTRIYNLYEGMAPPDDMKVLKDLATEFRGLTYNQWFELFMKYALVVAKYQNVDDGLSIAEAAGSANVFYQDKEKESIIKLVRLSISIFSQDYQNSIMTNVRALLHAFQFSPTILSIFMLCFPSGQEAVAAFTSLNHQKFFLRQIKAYDSRRADKDISGMATITNKSVNTSREHPQLLHIYSCLLAGSRSYIPSLAYAMRLYKEYNKDPLISFLIGLSHVHRAMQRLSNNRHIQILQGISFILEYVELRSQGASSNELQEIDYNLGRLYHLLGLSSIAIGYYEKVLEYKDIEDDFNLKYEAAYNMTLIYNVGGNSRMAKKITDEYLSI